MSISLNQGFANDTLDHCLEDLIVRFVVNCPEEDLSSYERVLFQIEEANWFYLDYVTTLNPLLQPKRMKQFTRSIVKLCPVVWKWGDPEIALASFGKYKSTIPVRGCALINQNMDKVLLVKGIESNSWGFPRGKISKDEKDVDCAIRELDEETGFDASDLIEDDLYVERTLRGKNYKIYIIKNVPEETEFNPKAKFEIVDIKWHSLRKLSKSLKSNTGNFFLINSMLKPIMSHINSWKNSDVDHLKSVATIQLKKLLGIGIEKKESVDPGRELLSFIQNAASKRSDIPKSEGTTATDATASTNLTSNTQMTPITLPPLPQLQLPPILPFMTPFFPPMGFGGFPFNMPPPPPLHPMFNNNGTVAHAPSASSLSKPNIRSKVSNSRELLSILTSKVLAPKMQQLPQSSSSGVSSGNTGNPIRILQRPDNSSPAPIKILKRGDELPQQSNASQLMNILKRPSQQMPISASSIRSDTPTSTKTELPTSSRASPSSYANDATLLKRPESSDSSSQLLNLLKKPTASPAPAKKSDSNQLLSLLKKPQVEATAKGSNQLLNILKKPSQDSNGSKQSTPTKSNESNDSAQLLNMLKKPRTPVQTPPPASGSNDSAQLLNLLKKPNTPSVESPAPTSDPAQLLNLLKKPSAAPVQQSPASSNGSAQLLNILKKPSTPPVQQQSPASSNGSAQLLNILKKPSATPVQQQSPASSNGSAQLLNILKKPSTPPVQQSPVSTSESNQLLNLLRKPSPAALQEQKQIPASNNETNQLINILKKPTPELKQAAPVSNTANGYDSDNDSDNNDDYEDFEDFEDDDNEGVNIGLYQSDSDLE